MTKMESEKESKNDHFCKSERRVQFFKNDPFLGSFSSHSDIHFWKMRLKMKSKMTRK